MIWSGFRPPAGHPGDITAYAGEGHPLLRGARDLAAACVGATGMFAALRWLRQDRVTILCYHSVVGTPLPPLVAYGGLHLPVRLFEEHLDYVRRHYQVVPLHQIMEAARTGSPLSPRAIAVTFDDGYANNVTRAAGILRRSRLRATLFLATDYLAGPDLFWWDELPAILSTAAPRRYTLPAPWGTVDLTSRITAIGVLHQGRQLLEAATLGERRGLLDVLRDAIMNGREKAYAFDELRPARWDELAEAADVFDYGGHTAGHRVLDLLQPDAAAREIERCRTAVADNLGPTGELAFCYPAGRFSDDAVTLVRRSGFAAAVTTRTGPPLSRSRLPAADRWRLPRIAVAAGTSTPVLAAKIGLV